MCEFADILVTGQTARCTVGVHVACAPTIGLLFDGDAEKWRRYGARLVGRVLRGHGYQPGEGVVRVDQTGKGDRMGAEMMLWLRVEMFVDYALRTDEPHVVNVCMGILPSYRSIMPST